MLTHLLMSLSACRGCRACAHLQQRWCWTCCRLPPHFGGCRPSCGASDNPLTSARRCNMQSRGHSSLAGLSIKVCRMEGMTVDEVRMARTSSELGMLQATGQTSLISVQMIVRVLYLTGLLYVDPLEVHSACLWSCRSFRLLAWSLPTHNKRTLPAAQKAVQVADCLLYVIFPGLAASSCLAKKRFCESIRINHSRLASLA